MMIILLVGHTHFRVDYIAVPKKTSVPESMLKKESNAIAFHFGREAVAVGIVRIPYKPSGNKKAYIHTQLLLGP
jgi:hypothetical protein